MPKQPVIRPEIRRMGDLARVREFVREIELMLDIIDDPNAFTTLDHCDNGPLNSLRRLLVSSKMACSNIMLDLGDGMRAFEAIKKPHQPGDTS
jgi:hypothetical protein